MKITWFAAILTSTFTNLNNGHISHKCWTGLLALLQKNKRLIIFAALNKFTVTFRGVSVEPGTGPEHRGTLSD